MNESKVVVFQRPPKWWRRSLWFWQVWEDRLKDEWPRPQVRSVVVRQGKARTREVAETDAMAARSQPVEETL